MKYILPASIVIVIASMLMWVRADSDTWRNDFSAYSVYNESDVGVSVAYEYLRQKIGSGNVLTYAHKVGHSPLKSNAVLFRIAPELLQVDEATDAESDEGFVKNAMSKLRSLFGIKKKLRDDYLSPSEINWVRSGGRLVLALRDNYNSLIIKSSRRKTTQMVLPALKGINAYEPPAVRSISGGGIKNMQTLFASRSGIAMARETIGKGEVYVISSPEVFDNYNITTPNNIALLEAFTQGVDTVYFDEYVHGNSYKLSAWQLLMWWGFGPALYTLVILFAMWFSRKSSVLGPQVDDHREFRVEAIDFVRSLAALYDRALKRRDLVVLYKKAFFHAARAKTALRGDALRQKIYELSDGQFNLDENIDSKTKKDISSVEFNTTLRAINIAFGRLNRDGKH